MNYQAPITLEHSLLSLKNDYLSITKADFNAPAPSKTGIFFGSKDTDTRMVQIHFLEALASTENPSNASNARDAYFEKNQLMVAACYLVSKQIASKSKVTPIYSELKQLIETALNTKNNPLDRHTLKECLHVLINCNKQKINEVLRQNKHNEITETEWQALKSLANTKIRSQKKHDDSPIADPLSMVGGIVLQPMGWGIGFALGQTLGKAGQSALLKNTLTLGLTSALICVGPLTGASSAAATFFARPHAEQAVEFAAGYGAAQLGGYAFKKIGQGTGWVLGKSIELAYDATAELSAKALKIVSSSGEVVELDIKIGLDLVNKELVAKSKTLTHENFIERIQEVLKEQEVAMKDEDNKMSQPKTLSFSIAKNERALLPQIIEILGYSQDNTQILDAEENKVPSIAI